MVTRGFTGRQSGSELSDRIPPGQHLVDNFPVLTAGPTPRIDPADWTFTLKIGPRPVKAWSWSEFNALPRTRMTRDIHCVTSWSKLNTAWEGVAIDDILAEAGLTAPTPFVLAHCYDGYSTNVPLADLATGKAMVALKYEGQPLSTTTGAGAPTRAASLLLEVGEVGERASVHGARRGRLLGAAWVPHVRRSLE
jgi:DMSO/TMAO reductase YedYZ molybdopterin-dependent catalytic subunit